MRPRSAPRPALQLSLQFARDYKAVQPDQADQPDQAGEGFDMTAHRAVLARHRVARWIRHALSCDAEIAVRIVAEAQGRELNRTYRHKDYATNVLTFDYQQTPTVQADLVLCAPVVAREAHALGRTLQAHYAHLLIHGTLHAQGWDHETSAEDAQEMEAYETALLRELGFEDPYASDMPNMPNMPNMPDMGNAA